MRRILKRGKMGCICVITKDKSLSELNLDNTIPFSMEGKKIQGKVLSVYDGDTITIGFKFGNLYCHKQCRIYGLDCAEIRTKNLEEKKVGLEAKEFLRGWIEGKIVSIDFSCGSDKYGRLLGKVEYNGVDVSEKMIEQKFGYAYQGEKKKTFEEWR